MKSDQSRSARAFPAFFGVLAVLGLAAHSGYSAPPKKAQIPKEISGDFTYADHIKTNIENERIEDDNKIVVEIDLTLSVVDPFGEAALYFMDNAGFSAQGKETVVSESAGCVSTLTRTRSGGGLMDPPSPDPYAPAPNPATLTWFIKDKKFAMHFQTPIQKGHVTQTSHSTCSTSPSEPVTSEYVWTCDLEGAVDYNPKTRTYRFVFLDKYQVPYRELKDLKCNVFVIGELSGKVR